MFQQYTLSESRNVPAGNGWYWINEGMRYFMGNKLAWLVSMFFVLFFSFFAINYIPGAQLILLFVFPFIAAGLSMACAEIENGSKMSFQFLFSAFTHPNRINLLRYGLLLLLLILVAQMISSIILGVMGVNLELITQALNAIKENQQASLQTIFASPILLRFFVVTVFSMLPIVMINLLAPILLVFSSLTAWQSIKMSFIAGVKNLGAFALYAAVYAGLLFVVVFGLDLVMQLLFAVLGENSVLAVYLYLLIFITIVLVIVSVSYSSAYVAFKDLFLGEQI